MSNKQVEKIIKLAQANSNILGDYLSATNTEHRIICGDYIYYNMMNRLLSLDHIVKEILKAEGVRNKNFKWGVAQTINFSPSVVSLQKGFKKDKILLMDYNYFILFDYFVRIFFIHYRGNASDNLIRMYLKWICMYYFASKLRHKTILSWVLVQELAKLEKELPKLDNNDNTNLYIQSCVDQIVFHEAAHNLMNQNEAKYGEHAQIIFDSIEKDVRRPIGIGDTFDGVKKSKADIHIISLEGDSKTPYFRSSHEEVFADWFSALRTLIRPAILDIDKLTVARTLWLNSFLMVTFNKLSGITTFLDNNDSMNRGKDGSRVDHMRLTMFTDINRVYGHILNDDDAPTVKLIVQAALDVWEFGWMLIDEHTKAKTNLYQIVNALEEDKPEIDISIKELKDKLYVELRYGALHFFREDNNKMYAHKLHPSDFVNLFHL